MKLYAVNTSCWTDYDKQNTSGDNLIENKLSDHFTFMYYNFMKYGLVDEVIIFLDEKRLKRDIDERFFETEYGNMTIVDRKQLDLNTLEKEQIVYCWSNWKECEDFKDNLVIVNPMFSNMLYPSVFTPEVHDYALIEGPAFSNTVPDWMPYDVFHYTTHDFSSIKSNQRKDSKRKYDWILVSSFDPRKRHIEFLREMLKFSEFKKLKGCIVGRNPDNKQKLNDGHFVLQNVLDTIRTNNLDIEVYLNASQEKKKNLMLESKVYVCPSSLDNGPRSMIEAAQAGCVLLAGQHIGSSGIIREGVNGAIFHDIKESPASLFSILKNYKKYDIDFSSRMLDPDNVYPTLVKKIMEKHSDKFK